MATKYAKKISEQDNVATCVADVSEGETVTVRFGGHTTEYQSICKVPFGHKIALKEIKKGEDIVKYGVKIGIASQPIAKGEWVHCHNCLDTYEVK